MNNMSPSGFIRLIQILGNPKAHPPIPAVIPGSKFTFWQGVEEGRYLQAVKLGKRCTAWRVEAIRRYIERVGGAA